MPPRAYRMERRADSAEETRARIVRATYELHAEQGIAATSVRDIAERAGVAVGSVYHHFPSYGDVVEACGRYTVELTRPPDLSILEGVTSPAERLRTMVEGVYGFYQRFPGFERVRADRDRYPPLNAFLVAEESTRRALLVAALPGLKASREALALGFAMLDVCVYRSLVSQGLSHAAAVQTVCAFLQQWLPAALSPTKPGRKAPR